MLVSNIAISRALELEEIIRFEINWQRHVIMHYIEEDFGLKDNSVVCYIKMTETHFVMNIAPSISKAFDKILSEKSYKYLVIDFTDVERIDSSGIGVILNLYNYFKIVNKRKPIFIYNLRAPIDRILGFVGVDVIMHTMRTLDEVKEKIQKEEKEDER